MRTPPTILVVDDNPMNVDILQTRLAVHGYQVLTANDGEEALATAREKQPDLILLDVMMPKMDGLEVCRCLRADPSLPFMPIVMVTAKGDTKDVVAGLEAGCDEYLTKPFDQAALVARVKSMLRIKALHDTVQEQAARLEAQAILLSEENRMLELRVAEHLAELRLASKIQHDLLPESSPFIPGYDIAGKTIPARMVGGDYFDFIPVGQSRWAICLGDVSGKGLPASLLMANLQATIRGQTSVHDSPSGCLNRSNTLLCRSTGRNKFVTFFYCILDARQHRLHYSNAGHDPPLFFPRWDSGPQPTVRLEAGGTVLGVLEDTSYEEEVILLNPGDLLLLYSDGITEANGDAEEEFGEPRLISVAREHRGDSAVELVERILGSVGAHTGDRPQYDDMTLVVVKRQVGDSSGVDVRAAD